MTGKKRILIAEDHTILREGLKALLSSDPGLEIAGEAQDGIEAVRKVNELNPDMIMIDLTMPRMNGMEAIREIKRSHPETRVLVLTVHKTEEYVLASLRAGADGYALKDSTHAELAMAIKSVLAGDKYLSPAISGKVISGYLDGKTGLKEKSSLEALTPREREVLKLIAEDYKNKEIADCLFISLKTVEKHRDNLMKKLDLHSASALTAFAIERGLVEK